MDFNALHQQNQPLLLANVWDASSAQAAQQAGYQALDPPALLSPQC